MVACRALAGSFFCDTDGIRTWDLDIPSGHMNTFFQRVEFEQDNSLHRHPFLALVEGMLHIPRTHSEAFSVNLLALCATVFLILYSHMQRWAGIWGQAPRDDLCPFPTLCPESNCMDFQETFRGSLRAKKPVTPTALPESSSGWDSTLWPYKPRLESWFGQIFLSPNQDSFGLKCRQ